MKLAEGGFFFSSLAQAPGIFGVPDGLVPGDPRKLRAFKMCLLRKNRPNS